MKQCVPAAAAAKSLQSCPTLCDPTDGSPPGSPVPESLQARTLEWVAISFSNAWKWKVKVKSLSRVPCGGFVRSGLWPSLWYNSKPWKVWVMFSLPIVKIKKPRRNRKESRRTVRKLSPLGQVRRDDAVDQMAVTQFLDVFLGKRWQYILIV